MVSVAREAVVGAKELSYRMSLRERYAFMDRFWRTYMKSTDLVSAFTLSVEDTEGFPQVAYAQKIN